MKPLYLLLISLLLVQNVFSQKSDKSGFAETDQKALSIPDSMTNSTVKIAAYMKSSFASEKERIRGIFIWVTSNIVYDVDNMYALNYYEKKEEKILKSLRTRKGICENYAVLFTDICTRAGIKSITVYGYTRQKRSVDFVPHAWCAVIVDSV